MPSEETLAVVSLCTSVDVCLLEDFEISFFSVDLPLFPTSHTFDCRVDV